MDITGDTRTFDPPVEVAAGEWLLPYRDDDGLLRLAHYNRDGVLLKVY